MTIKRCYPVLVGASVVENQLVNPTYFQSRTNNGITVTADTTTGEITVSGTATANATIVILNNFLEVKNRHVYYLSQPQGATGSTFWFRTGENTFWNYKQIGKSTDETVTSNLRVYVASGQTVNFKIKPQFIDLTAELGSTIADYVYTLETATAGAGIAKLREWGFLTGGYIPYNAGSLESVEATAHKMVGFNQWDEEWELGYYNVSDGLPMASSSNIRSKNYIPAIGNTNYYCKTPTGYIAACEYDGNKNFIKCTQAIANSGFTSTDNTCYLRFHCTSAYGTIYNHDICINISNPDRNGEYEPYTSTSYPLGSDVLRGIFKLDTNNQLYADGDRKEADGTITRRYGTRAYQEGDESLADAITDGTTTVYKLTTPTTETSTPFTSPQIVYPDGTEEFVTETDVPVGHETKYQL